VIMAEFYGYRLQHWDTNGIALLWGGRLRQQYIVDAYAVIEQNRLKYLCLNQKKNSCRFLSKPPGCHHCKWQWCCCHWTEDHSAVFFHRRSMSHGLKLSRRHGNL
jgi:hypothetical protein